VSAHPFVARALSHLPARRLWILASGLLVALALTACGNKQAHPTTADNEGFYVDAGPITYQVQLSRELNPFNIEDREYISGATGTQPKPNEEWFAVFLWAKNQTGSNQTTTDTFDILDTQGNRYFPVPLNPKLNPFAWTAQTLAPLGTEPAPESAASFGPTQGGELLFKLNTSVYSNRPLTLQIYARGQAKPSSVSLDL
jgi:hypothetical protein